MKQLEKEMRLPPDGIVSSQIDLCMWFILCIQLLLVLQ
jgi:hypothetical protein